MWIWAGFPWWRGCEEWFLSLWNLSAASGMVTCSSWGDRPWDLDLFSSSVWRGDQDQNKTFKLTSKDIWGTAHWRLLVEYYSILYIYDMCIYKYIYILYGVVVSTILGIVRIHELGNPFLTNQYKGTFVYTFFLTVCYQTWTIRTCDFPWQTWEETRGFCQPQIAKPNQNSDTLLFQLVPPISHVGL